MIYDYSIRFNEHGGAWQVSWTEHDPEHPHHMKGDIETCDSFDGGLEKIRDFVTKFEPSRLRPRD